MQEEPVQSEESEPDIRQRIAFALPAVLVALNIVLVAIIVARPWESTPEGLAPQVQPISAAGRDLPTGPVVGSLAPNFRIEDLDGNMVELADLRGRPVFLNFWATWCIFCVSEMPAIQRVADRYDDEIVVIGINVGESASTARTFAENFDIEYVFLFDVTIDVTEAYQARAMPTSLFLDGDGAVREVRYGPVLPEEMGAALEPLLEATPGAD